MCFLSISVQLHWKDSRSKGKLTAKTSGRDGMPHGCVRPRIDERQREGENDDRSSVELVVSSRGNGIARAGIFVTKLVPVRTFRYPVRKKFLVTEFPKQKKVDDLFLLF